MRKYPSTAPQADPESLGTVPLSGNHRRLRGLRFGVPGVAGRETTTVGKIPGLPTCVTRTGPFYYRPNS